jgi:hypothetical protein
MAVGVQVDGTIPASPSRTRQPQPSSSANQCVPASISRSRPTLATTRNYRPITALEEPPGTTPQTQPRLGVTKRPERCNQDQSCTPVQGPAGERARPHREPRATGPDRARLVRRQQVHGHNGEHERSAIRVPSHGPDDEPVLPLHPGQRAPGVVLASWTHSVGRSYCSETTIGTRPHPAPRGAISLPSTAPKARVAKCLR